VSVLDALVVGGGPAGSTTAARLAAAGLRVALAERARFPRDKVCGEFVSGESLGVLERLELRGCLEEAGAARIERVRVTTAGGRAFASPLPRDGREGPGALGVSRGLLDERLLRRAGELGAELLEETELVGLGERESDGTRRLRLRRRGGGESERLCRALVAADGRRGSVARLLGLRHRSPRGRRAPYGLQVHLSGIRPRLEGRVELHFVGGGYLGLGPVEGGLVDAALLASRERFRRAGGPEEVLRAFTAESPEARGALEGARPEGPFRSIGPLGFGPLRAAREGVFFVGDAAGTVDPFAGEGIAMALRGGERLGALLARALQGPGRVGREIERAWRTAWRRAFLGRMRLCRLLGRLAAHPFLLEPAVALLARRDGLARSLVAATRPGAGAAGRLPVAGGGGPAARM
jgi:flavin-dependent dehydrogenase